MRVDHNWIKVNVGGESIAMCDECGKTFGEADEQEEPNDCFGDAWDTEETP